MIFKLCLILIDHIFSIKMFWKNSFFYCEIARKKIFLWIINLLLNFDLQFFISLAHLLSYWLKAFSRCIKWFCLMIKSIFSCFKINIFVNIRIKCLVYIVIIILISHLTFTVIDWRQLFLFSGVLELYKILVVILDEFRV